MALVRDSFQVGHAARAPEGRTVPTLSMYHFPLSLSEWKERHQTKYRRNQYWQEQEVNLQTVTGWTYTTTSISPMLFIPFVLSLDRCTGTTTVRRVYDHPRVR